MWVEIVFLVGLLTVGQVLAVDEDFYIPYTDTYGYVYDPKTRQYVKQDAAPSSDTVVQKPDVNATVTVDPQDQVNPVVTGTLDASKGIPAYYILISGVIIVLVASAYWSLQRKKTR